MAKMRRRPGDAGKVAEMQASLGITMFSVEGLSAADLVKRRRQRGELKGFPSVPCISEEIARWSWT
jgi:hypothetical protein